MNSLAVAVAAPPRELVEAFKCAQSCAYFLETYVQIYDGTTSAWRPFTLWPAQRRVLRDLQAHRQLVILKARQLGLTWLVLGYFLWLMLFHPAATILLFSKRQDEAWELIRRLKGMYARLPVWLQARAVDIDNDGHWALSNGSQALANASDSHTATAALADEFDLVEDQEKLITSVKPTTDAGGQLILLSRVNKRTINSLFQRIYVAARKGLNAYFPIFLPWFARPDRDAAWYAAQQADVLANTGRLDNLYEQYPASETEALAPRALGGLVYDCYNDALDIDGGMVVLDRTFPATWLRWVGLDFGGINTAAVLLTADPAADPATRVYYLYREYHAGNRTAVQHVTAIRAGEPTELTCVGGSKSEGQWRMEFATGGLAVHPPVVRDVEIGIQRVYGLIQQGRLRIAQSCVGVRAQLNSYQRETDAATGQPTPDILHKATYHYLDALRYIGQYLARSSGKDAA